MRTTALELVPTDVKPGLQQAREIAQQTCEFLRACGLAERVRHVMIPDMIAEDSDRPVQMRPKLDTLDFWQNIRPELDGISGLCTQVTAFRDEGRLRGRLRRLCRAGMSGVVFVGVPRAMGDGEGPGLAPAEALSQFRDIVPDRGVILIPTRQSESARFGVKCDSGATFALTQLLYSTAIADFLEKFAAKTPHRPEIFLSFGFVAGVESRLKLIDWLIQDPGNAKAAKEQAFVADLADRPYVERSRQLVDLYQRVIDSVHNLGFPLSVHLEAPYGNSKAAFETFAKMLDYWEPGITE